MRYLLGNWKMNMTADEVGYFAKRIRSIKYTTDFVGVAVPFAYLGLKGNFRGKIKIGAQNVSQFDSGAYTGEISAKMLKDMEADFCLIGHSERRTYFNESNEVINKKAKLLLSYEILPVICVGERENDATTKDVLRSQVTECLAGIEPTSEVVIAYEPVWAIGTGVTPSSAEIEERCNFILKVIEECLGVPKPVLYGGSVKSSNSGEIMAKENVSGLLVGGASLDATEFEKILETL